ncbi:ABC transporter permease subunit [Luteolibacter ambystomatis]|uniref:ABC transporter permease subunit n=1 Tax=Luteolibacter ambystomatis TaxID=2824561 RepID=A0A975IYX7_9BACT|nr:ABC transporter permease subunit [Luteolibacter ambystomatis]QUE50594.1 ABC transporter permease subunit [Luteolibacter ambystomatis]
MTHAPTRKHPLARPRRIAVIAGHAFTQLVRMKVFYFLAIFALIAIASNFFDLPQHEGPEAMGAKGLDILRLIKSWSLGAMTLFSVVFGIVSTALLLPKDVEDRTLYTILAKPVPRIDYLIGKLGGVLLLLAVSLGLMDLLMTGMLHIRMNIVLEVQKAMADSYGWDQAARDSLTRDTLLQGPTWSLQGAVAAVFLRSAVMAAVALLISTFSSSTLFTAVVSFLVYFIGHFQGDVLGGGDSGQSAMARYLGQAVAMVFPDFQLFNVIDAVIQGKMMEIAQFGKLVWAALYYIGVYVFGSWFVFSDKEF